MERGKARYSFVASGSNNVLTTRPTTLYSIQGDGTTGPVRVDDSHRFPQGVLDLNAASSNTVGHFTPPVTFVQGIGLDTGLALAFGSNTLGITVEYE